MSKTTTFVAFIIGVTVGSAVTWKFIDSKYKQIAQDEIDSVKEVFAKRSAELVKEPERSGQHPWGSDEARIKADDAKEKPNIVNYATVLRDLKYKDLDDNKLEEEDEEPVLTNKPYIITPEEFGEFDEYETISLTYYVDKVLVDDNEHPVDDVDDIVGFDSLNRFGEYENDSVFVRNDKLKCDYEILLDQRRYHNVKNRKPHEVD